MFIRSFLLSLLLLALFVSGAQARVLVKDAGDGDLPAGYKARVVVKIQGAKATRIQLLANGQVIAQKKVRANQYGRASYTFQRHLIRPSKYKVRVYAANRRQVSRAFRLVYPDLDQGDSGRDVAIFHNLLEREGYGNAPDGKRFTSRTSLAVMALRKVNNLSRDYKTTPALFKMLAAGKGAFEPRYNRSGRYVEADISRQVMVLINNGKPRFTYHISSGAPATPSDLGHYTFYRKDAGYNSLGMYYSVYYNGGEATHGYHSVPTYNASHGCLRNPIPDSKFIYRWISLGDDIWVYN